MTIKVTGYGLVIWIVAVVILVGCGGHFGRLQPSREITALFRQDQIDTDYNYYYTGRSAIPYAVVGIKKNYVMDETFWKPVNGKREIRRLVDRLYGSDWWRPYGAAILDPQGAPMGVWYSVYSTTRVKFGPDNRVNVFSPYIPSRSGSPGHIF